MWGIYKPKSRLSTFSFKWSSSTAPCEIMTQIVPSSDNLPSYNKGSFITAPSSLLVRVGSVEILSEVFLLMPISSTGSYLEHFPTVKFAPHKSASVRWNFRKASPNAPLRVWWGSGRMIRLFEGRLSMHICINYKGMKGWGVAKQLIYASHFSLKRRFSVII